MLKKILLTIAILIVVLITAGYVFRNELTIAIAALVIAPDHDFDAAIAPAAPDYSDPLNWAALPDKADPSDDRPTGAKDAEFTGTVGVFFIHPTSYLSKENWNQPLDDDDANWIVDQRILRHQASVFNGCCDVYAPRYRQATIFSFMDSSSNGSAALDLAYQDVERAFDHFLSELDDDAPFILAGHSQGTSHGGRLLRDKISNTPLQDRLVAAYLIGFSIEKDQTGGVVPCTYSGQTGCVIGWNATEGNGNGLFPDAGDLVCTNPLTWENEGGYAGHELNQGGIGYPTYGRPEGDEDVTLMTVEQGAADAECRGGLLSIPELRSDAFPSRMQGNSMHVYDYSLFYLNLRTNATERVAAFLAEHYPD